MEEKRINKKDRLTLWTIFLVNPERIGGKEMLENEGIKEAKELYEKIRKNEKEIEIAEMRLNYIRDKNAIRKHGYESGRKEGMEEGKKQEKKEIAKKMLKTGMETKDIEEITGLTKIEIEELKNQLV